MLGAHKKTPSNFLLGVEFGGIGGIRTLDGFLRPILP